MRAAFAASLLCAVAAVTLSAVAPASKKDAELLKQKVATIKERASAKPSAREARTMVTEDELNSYLVYEAGSSIPTGVVDPAISILGTGRVAARAIVDLDAVNKSRKSASVFDPVSYLSGKLPIEASGRITTSAGVGHFSLDTATVGSVPVPKMVLQEIVSFYSRSEDNPQGMSLDDPFELPARIQEIQVLRGQAIIVQ